MVSMMSLWLPIVLSAGLVFLASFVLHMVLTYHRSDVRQLPAEARVQDAVRGTPVGSYFFPHAASPKELSNPAMIEKFKTGPVGILTVLPSGPPTMTKNLAQWFAFCVVVGVFVAYLTSRTVPAGAAAPGPNPTHHPPSLLSDTDITKQPDRSTGQKEKP